MKTYRSNLSLFGLVAAAFAMTHLSMADADGGGSTGTGTPPTPDTKKKTVYVDVTMKVGNADGTPRIVKFPESAKVKKEILELDGKPHGVRFDFKNGESSTVTIDEIVKWNLLERFAVHGASQKFGDAYAGDKDVDDAFESFSEVLQVAAAGKWSEETAGSGGGSSVLLKALVELTGKTIEEVRTILSETSQKEKLGLRQDPRVAAIIQRLEQEKAGTVDTSKALGALGLAAA